MSFLGEGYSREGYNKAEKELKDAKDAEMPGEDFDRRIYNFGPQNEKNWRRFYDAQDKVLKLKEMGNAEAIELENEHNRLAQAVMDAQKALATFESEKLEMKD